MISQLFLKVEGQQSMKDTSTLIKSVWIELLGCRKERKAIDFLKLIVSGNPRFTVEEDVVLWHGINYDVVFSDNIPQLSNSLSTLYMPMTEENLKVILRLELYHAFLNEYDVCLQDKAKAIWKVILEQTI